MLTNSRGFTVAETTRAHIEIGENVDAVAREFGTDYLIISRGDSTLRGHYPLETDLLRQVGEQRGGYRMDGEILCPYFKEGGRFTLDNVHYVRYGDVLTPCGETEFARDETFGYRSSNLCDYIEEKTRGAWRAADVTCIPLESLRALDFDAIEAQLLAVHDFGKVIVNAVDDCDVKAFAVALYRAMAKGRHFTIRCAAYIAAGTTCCVSTRRTVLTLPDDTPEAALVRSVAISDALQSCVGKLPVTPAFVVVKGGITSSDVGVKALRVKCAKVLGQIRPGIPVWQTGAESLFPGTPYIIFPGNVGEVPTLREAVEILLG